MSNLSDFSTESHPFTYPWGSPCASLTVASSDSLGRPVAPANVIKFIKIMEISRKYVRKSLNFPDFLTKSHIFAYHWGYPLRIPHSCIEWLTWEACSCCERHENHENHENFMKISLIFSDFSTESHPFTYPCGSLLRIPHSCFEWLTWETCSACERHQICENHGDFTKICQKIVKFFRFLDGISYIYLPPRLPLAHPSLLLRVAQLGGL